MRLDKRITALGLTRAQAKRLIARGEVRLDSALAPGESRPLTAQEAESLYRAVRLDPAHQD